MYHVFSPILVYADFPFLCSKRNVIKLSLFFNSVSSSNPGNVAPHSWPVIASGEEMKRLEVGQTITTNVCPLQTRTEYWKRGDTLRTSIRSRTNRCGTWCLANDSVSTLSLINRYKFSLDFRFGTVTNSQKWTIPFYAMPCLIALFIASFARFSAFHWY